VKAFLAVSVTPECTHPAARVPVASALDRLTGVAAVRTYRIDGGWVGLTPPDPDDLVGHPERGFTARLTRTVRGRDAGEVSTARLADLLGEAEATDRGFVDGDALAGLLPPFAAAHYAGPGCPVVLAGDWLGLRQLYWWQGDGIAAVATNAVALATLLETGLDVTALSIQAAAGWQIGEGTLFRGVRKLAPGCVALLRNGRVTIRRYAEQRFALDDPPPTPAAAIEELADYLRGFLSSYLADHPDATLQLSGGLDSRLLLGAIPPGLRTGLSALTLDLRGGIESRIATRLAEMCGLRHRVVHFDDQPPLDPKTAYRLCVEAAAALDCMSNPIALAPVAHAESTLTQGHRLSGQGGEATRISFFGQSTDAPTTPRRVEQFINWRIVANDGAGEALDPDFAAVAHRSVRDIVNECFAGFSSNWLRATDEWYLWQRAQRWGGSRSTVAAIERWSVDPMFDRRFQELSLALAPVHRRDARFTGQLIARLDPQLAAVPVDSGLVPAQLGRHGFTTTAAVARVTVRRFARKVRQRFGQQRSPQLGAAGMAALVVEHWRNAPEVLEPVRRAGVICSSWLDGLLSGRHGGNASTVGFLVNLLVAHAAATGARPPVDLRWTSEPV
jgi:asparagine synthase (glutamine-hydrolysing)